MSDNSKPTQNGSLSFELTDWIDDAAGGTEYGPPTEEDVLAMAAALRAVVDAHQPRRVVRWGHGGHLHNDTGWCRGCDLAWPCPTITTIQTAIGGDQ